MVQIEIEQGIITVDNGVYTGPPELQGLFDILSETPVATWEGPEDYAYAVRMAGEQPFKVLVYDDPDSAENNDEIF